MSPLRERLSYLLLGQKGGHNRIQIIEALGKRPYNVNQLAEHLGLNYRTVKHHMDVLRKHRLVYTSDSDGFVELYFLSPEIEHNMELFEDITYKLKDSTFSNRFLQNVLEQTNDAVIILDQNDHVVFWNNGAERIFGHNEVDVLGSELSIFQEPDFFSETLREIENGKHAISVETEATHKNGDVLELSLTVDRIVAGENNFIGHSVIARDITEQKRAQEQTIKVKERLEHILSSLSTAIFTERTSEDYRATFISDNISKLVGYEPSEFIENPGFWLDHVHPDDRKRVLEEISKIVQKGHHMYEYRFKHKNGDYVWLRDDMNCIRDKDDKNLKIMGFCTDITKRREVEEPCE